MQNLDTKLLFIVFIVKLYEYTLQRNQGKVVYLKNQDFIL